MLKSEVAPRASLACLVIVLLLIVSTTAFGRGTAFTYQGRLTDSGNVANGTYDMQFKLFDTATVGTGTPQGSTLMLTNVTVTAGLFTVQLDFGACASCFNGEARFNISGSGTVGGTLSGNVVNAAAHYNIAGLKVLSVSGPFNDGTINLAASNTFAGEGAGLNTTPDATLGLSFGKFNSFFGADAGKANTDGNSNSFFGARAGAANSEGVANSFFGTEAGASNTTGIANTFFGKNDELQQRVDEISRQKEELKRQLIQIDSLKKIVCLDHPAADICARK